MNREDKRMTPGDEDRIDQLRAAWMQGESARPLIEELIRLKRMVEAGALARLTLDSDECQDRERFERLLEQTGCPPPGWTEALVAFSRTPTLENWDRLMRFTPDNVFYHRTRNAIRLLRRLGTDPNALFRCATWYGTTPDAFELIQSGEVHPDTVVARAQMAPSGARALWLGMAAEAAYAQGDDLGTVRLLKRAYAEATEMVGPEISARSIREKANSNLQVMLDKIGIPRFE
jgi:hypothetical protein